MYQVVNPSLHKKNTLNDNLLPLQIKFGNGRRRMKENNVSFIIFCLLEEIFVEPRFICIFAPFQPFPYPFAHYDMELKGKVGFWNLF